MSVAYNVALFKRYCQFCLSSLAVLDNDISLVLNWVDDVRLIAISYILVQSFPNFLAWKNPSDNSVYPEELPFMNMFTGKKKRWLVTRGDYSNIANCRTKILVISQGTFVTFHVIVTCLCTYSMISR